MRRINSLRICAVAAAVALGPTQASACDSYCGYGYVPQAYAYYAPPIYYVAPPVYAYYAPPVYSYYAPSAYEYYERVNVFRGPRWGYGATYYNSPSLYGGIWRSGAYGYYGGPRAYARPYRGYVRGPAARTWRRW